MKHKIINPNSNFALEIPDKKRNDKILQPYEEIGKSNIYWYAYAYSSPFMPMIDATLAFAELKKLVKKWLSKKNLSFKKNS
ncbi:hypothetical protein [Chryseobacterium sp. R2ACT005]|uniref:hypothetical protein n=1 Tax=Chryseobacterium sp. R2ACT005 TaxID=3416668 RepID=UPI003CE6F2D8